MALVRNFSRQSNRKVRRNPRAVSFHGHAIDGASSSSRKRNANPLGKDFDPKKLAHE